MRGLGYLQDKQRGLGHGERFGGRRKGDVIGVLHRCIRVTCFRMFKRGGT